MPSGGTWTVKALDNPDSWLQLLARQIEQFGPDNDHASYRNSGRAHELFSPWAELAARSQLNGQAVQALYAASDAETARQDIPIHSMWCEIRRGFVAWARSRGQNCPGGSQ
jgi:hypothetical protein